MKLRVSKTLIVNNIVSQTPDAIIFSTNLIQNVSRFLKIQNFKLATT